ncbi:MAG: hypothetical protein K0R52_1262, partial [Alphaproteobacteria bacterium]|nr:hypothetical protein [Alphaproteobacteria bacterium]
MACQRGCLDFVTPCLREGYTKRGHKVRFLLSEAIFS